MHHKTYPGKNIYTESLLESLCDLDYKFRDIIRQYVFYS